MKKIIFVISAVLFSTYSFSQRVSKLESDKTTQKVEKEAPKTQTQTEAKVVNATIDFESKVVDYGTIEHNADGKRKFVFTNNGTEPLVIKNAKGSCGCTVPTWPREPIAPGATAEIGVKYATNRVGKFTKTITLTTNADKKPVILTIKGEVNPAPKEASAPERKTEGSPLEKK